MLGITNDYPQDISSDVDIVVNELEFKNFAVHINNFCSLYKLETCNVFQHEICSKYFIISDPKSPFELLALDICSNYMRKGKTFINAKDILTKKTTFNAIELEFNIPSVPIAFYYYFIKKIEKKELSKMNEIQFHYFKKLLSNNRNEILLKLNSIFAKDSTKNIEAAFTQFDFTYFTREVEKELSAEIHKKHKVKSHIKILELFRKIQRFTTPTGLTVCFLGCDGSGKSTIIKQLTDNTSKFEAFRGYEYHHLYAKKKDKTNEQVITNPHNQKSRSRLFSNLKLIYFLYKYLYGYWFIAYPQKVKSKLVIFDRYYFDILVDPKRYRHNGSKWLTTLIGKMIPKPDLFFLIDAPAEVIQSRKKEVTLEETRRQRNEYIQLKKTLTHFHIIDNSQKATISSEQVKKTIINHLVQRFKDRYTK